MSKMSLDEKRELTKKARQACNEKYPDNSSPFFSEKSKIKANKTNAKKATFIEKKLRYFLDELGIKYETNFHIKTDFKKNNGQYKYYFPDIYIPDLNIILEADGIKWHNKQDDKIRDINIKRLIDADVFRFSEYDIRNNGDLVFNKIKNIINNHSGNFKQVEARIINIERVKLGKNNMKTLFNFSVEEDESYVADGIIVHNCRCQLHEVPEGYVWNDDKQMFVAPEANKNKPKYGIKVKVGDKEFSV
jgi:very-short-patch-repair endonuclease